jgi:type IV pilus secretin PilQ/predicted competence protein
MRAKLAWALLLVVAPFTVAVSSASAEDRAPISISDIRQESTDRSTRLTVECSAPVAYATFSPDPLTLVVDIPEADTSKVPARINVGTREVDSLRVTTLGRADGRSIARIEVHLASLVVPKVFSKDRALNLVFERAAQTSAKPETQAAPVEVPAPQPTAAAEVAEAPAEPSAPVAKAKGEPVSAPAGPVAKGPASTILGVTQSMDDGQLAITVQANGSLHYQDFFLGNPDRLVVDFKDVMTRAPKALDVTQGPVRKVRIGQFSAATPKVARLVLDLSARSPYHIVEARDGVKILFGEGGRTTSPAPLAALRTDPPPATTALAMPASVIVPAPAQAPPPALAMPSLPAQQEPPKESFEAKTIGQAPKVYTGHPINLDFKDGDLQDIFRLFADISGLNVVVNPGVSGKVTLKLTEVPWDQALDLILKTNGLGRTIDDNVIRIARLSDLQKEEEDLRKLKENQALAGDLTTWRKSLSYAKAVDLEPSVKKVALSPRGQITLDTRTNTMIITDLPTYLDKARDLINDLDRATKQVEIEARIVVTSRNFTRDLGIQWGFSQRQTPEFANQTNKTFPSSIILNGQGTPSQLGLPADQGALGTGASATGTAGRGYAVNLPASSFNSAIGISLGNILGNFNLDAALTALEKQGRGRILSTPKVTTQNNQPAEIKQGVQIPLQTIANNTVTVQFKDAVLTLKVTPQITEADTVILNLEVENNTADFANEVNGIPPINTQSAKTIVLVRDGATSVIGGIYQSNEQTAQSATPFLGKLPILGYLFRNRFVSTSNNELLLFITPRIVKS